MSRSSLAEFKPLDELPAFTRTAMLDLLARGNDFTFEAMSARMSATGIDVLVDLSWIESRGSGKNRRTVTLSRTILFFHRPECRLPDFTITHHEGFLGRLFSSRSGSVEAPSLEFKDRDSFNDKYTVQSPVPISATTLFDDALVAALDVHDGMDVVGDQNGIMVWRDADDSLGDELRAELVHDASAIFLPIANDPDRGNRVAASHPGTYMDEQVKRWKQDDSSEARAMLRKLVTREQVDRFVDQPVPRTVPYSILRRTMGGTKALLIAGLVMLILFGALGTMGLIFTNYVFAAIMLLLGSAGGLTSAMTWTWRRKRLRMIQHGQIVDARIISVEVIDAMSEDELLHTITFQTAYGNSFSMDLRSDPTRIARDLMYSDAGTQVLIDPDRTDVGIWLEGWIVENIPD